MWAACLRQGRQVKGVEALIKPTPLPSLSPPSPPLPFSPFSFPSRQISAFSSPFSSSSTLPSQPPLPKACPSPSRCLSPFSFTTLHHHLHSSSSFSKEKEKPSRENILTVPNVLSLSRLLLAPVIGFFVVQGNFPYALTGFFVAGLTDFLDGQIARHFNQGTIFGTVLDPMADKLLMSTMTVTLAYAGYLPLLPLLPPLCSWSQLIRVLAAVCVLFRSVARGPRKLDLCPWFWSHPFGILFSLRLLAPSQNPKTLFRLSTSLGRGQALICFQAEYSASADLDGIYHGWYPIPLTLLEDFRFLPLACQPFFLQQNRFCFHLKSSCIWLREPRWTSSSLVLCRNDDISFWLELCTQLQNCHCFP